MRYTYAITLNGTQHTCTSVTAVTDIINAHFGCKLCSDNMIFNYFCRPAVANKKLLQSPMLTLNRSIKPSS